MDWLSILSRKPRYLLTTRLPIQAFSARGAQGRWSVPMTVFPFRFHQGMPRRPDSPPSARRLLMMNRVKGHAERTKAGSFARSTDDANSGRAKLRRVRYPHSDHHLAYQTVDPPEGEAQAGPEAAQGPPLGSPGGPTSRRRGSVRAGSRGGRSAWLTRRFALPKSGKAVEYRRWDLNP